MASTEGTVCGLTWCKSGVILLVPGLFFVFKNVSHEALNLKRLDPLDRDVYQKTVRDLPSVW